MLSGPSVWSRSMAERCCLMLITLFTPLWAAVWLTHAHTWLKPHNAPHCIIGNLLLKDTVRTSHNTLATIQMPLATAAHRWNPRTHMMWEFELKHVMLRVNQSKSLQVYHTEASYTHIWRSKTTWRTITKICSFTWTNQKNTKHTSDLPFLTDSNEIQKEQIEQDVSLLKDHSNISPDLNNV